MAEKRIAKLFSFGPDRRHPIDKSLHVTRKIVVTVFGEQVGYGAPTVLGLAPCFYKRASTGFDAGVALQKFGCDGFGLCSYVGRVAAEGRTIDAILLSLSSFAADCALCGISLDA